MIRNPFLYLLITAAVVLGSCQRDDQDISEVIDVIAEDTEKYFDTNIIGKVQDAQGVEIKNVKVSLGSQNDFTSDDGVFLFNNVKTNSAGSMIKLSKSGYFDRFIFVTKEAEQYTNLNTFLKERTNPISFSASDYKDIKAKDNISLQIPSEAFADNNGNTYTGQVNCYINLDPVQGNVPFIGSNLVKGILVQSSQVQFVFEAQDGSSLQIKKSLTLTSPLGMEVGGLDTSKDRWIDLFSVALDGTLQTFIQGSGPYTIGQKEGITKIKTKIVSPANEGVSFTQLEIYNGFETWVYTPDQNGNISFYAPSNVNLELTVKSLSGQKLAQKLIVTGGESEKLEVPIQLVEEDLIAIKSDILSCDAPISNQDLVNVSLTGGEKTIHLYQSQNNQTFVMPIFHKIEKAVYYRGKQRKFSIAFSGYQSQKVININAAPLCMEKISGFVNINDMPRFFDKNQYSIFREFQMVETLNISDVSGFLISIPNVTSVGSYKPDAILFNHPEITDCIGQQCSDMTVFIDEYKKPGDPVKIRLEGTIGNKRVKGEFINILKN